jgi:hypothetical protein
VIEDNATVTVLCNECYAEAAMELERSMRQDGGWDWELKLPAEWTSDGANWHRCSQCNGAEAIKRAWDARVEGIT